MGEEEEEEEEELEEELEEREEQELAPADQNRPCAKAAYAQCGGKGFAGDACCPVGTVCTETNEWWSACMPSKDSSASTCSNSLYFPCGGAAFTGETCCPAGASCVVTNEWVSLCQPSPATSFVAAKRHFLASAGSVLLQSGSATQAVESSSELQNAGLVDADRSEL